MTIVRLLADDLTGALDTAAEFVPLTGELPVFWPGGSSLELEGSLGLDSGTRERDAEAAAAEVARLAPSLDGADIAFKKIDSLMRGADVGRDRGLHASRTSGGSVFWRRHFRIRGGSPARAGNIGAKAADGYRSVMIWRPACVHSAFRRSEDTATPICCRASLSSMLRQMRICGGSSPLAGDAADPVLWVGTGGLAQALTRRLLAAGTHAAASADPGAVRIRSAGDRRPARRLASRIGCISRATPSIPFPGGWTRRDWRLSASGFRPIRLAPRRQRGLPPRSRG